MRAFFTSGFEVTSISNTNSAHHSTACIETGARWSTKQLFWVPSNPCGFHLPLEVRQTHHETTGLSPLYWVPAEQKPGSYAGFWVACLCFRGITVCLCNKERGMNPISPQCHTNSHVFHTLRAPLLLTLTLPPLCKPFLDPPLPPPHFTPYVILCPGGTYLVSSGQYSVIDTECSTYTFPHCCQYKNNKSGQLYILLQKSNVCSKKIRQPIPFLTSFTITKTNPLLSFLSFLRCEEGLVRPRSVVGEKEDMAVENPLDTGQVRYPSRRQAALHAAAQAPAPPTAQHEAHEGQGQLLRPRL